MTEQTADYTQLVTFKIVNEEYGVPIMEVREIIRMAPVNRVATAPEFVEGIMALRGDVLLVVDLRRRLKLPSVERTKKSRIVVVTAGQRTVGLVVDSICAVLRVPNGEVMCSGQLSGLLGSSHVSGIARVGDRLIMVLNLDKVLSTEDLDGVSLAALSAVREAAVR